MAGRRGRPNTDQLSRVGRILALLRDHPAGLTTQELLGLVGYGDAQHASQMRQLNRDLAYLSDQGWQIDAIPDGNQPARRVLRTVDTRFATLFTGPERAELARAAACAGPEIATALAVDIGRADPDGVPFQLAPGDGRHRLAGCQAAAADRCTLAFDYGGRRRITSPAEVLLGSGMWYLRALDHADGQVKTFAVERMRALKRGSPGSARRIPAGTGPAVLDPLALKVNPPVQVIVRTRLIDAPDVILALAGDHPVAERPVGTGDGGANGGGHVELTVTMTNLDALPARLFELGRRVHLVGPPEVRERIAAQLREFLS